ncbi:MAG: GAF domain-containing protein [Candidatus Sericytochromatia bacterium]|nr:GAF domain-containing protein [Candidatus Tanganyikabacteria bacterium]
MTTPQLVGYMDFLGRAGESLSGAGSASELIGRCLALLCEETGAFIAALASADASDGRIRFTHSHGCEGKVQEAYNRWYEVSNVASPAADAHGLGQAIVFGDLAAREEGGRYHVAAGLSAALGARSAAFLPLLCQGRSEGALCLLLRERFDLSESLLAVLGAVAGQLGFLVRQGRQEAELERQGAELERRGTEVERRGTELERRGAELERQGEDLGRRGTELERRGAELDRHGEKLERRAALLAEASSLQAREEPIETTMRRGLESLGAALGAVFSVLWLPDPSPPELRLGALYVAGAGGPTPEQLLRDVIEAGPRSGAVRAYSTREPVIVADALATDFPVVRRYAECLGMRSAVFMPLIHRGEALGAVGMGFGHVLDFEADQRILAVFADQIAALVHEARLRAELARKSAFLESLVATAPLVIAYLDRDLVFRWVNPAALALSPVPGETFVGRRLFEVFPLVERPNPRFDVPLGEGRPIFIKGNPLTTESGCRRVVTYWDMAICRAAYGSDEPGGVLLICQDATERVLAEQRQEQRIAVLEELDRLKQNFLNVASHEFRTPLSSIIGYSEFLEDGLGGALTAGQAEFVQQIQAGARRLRHIVDDILDFARLEAGTFRLARREIELGMVVEGAVTSMQPQAADAAVNLRLKLPARPLTVDADPQRIGQVVLNLVGNAVKFAPGGRVEVAVKRRADQAVVDVRHGHRYRSRAHVAAVGQVLPGGSEQHARTRGRGPGPGHRPRAGRGARGAHLGQQRAGQGKPLRVRDPVPGRPSQVAARLRLALKGAWRPPDAETGALGHRRSGWGRARSVGPSLRERSDRRPCRPRWRSEVKRAAP